VADIPESAARAAGYRRAAALYTHWRRKGTGTDGELAILAEVQSEDGWVQLVCALLNLTDGLIQAARDGREDEYLAWVLRSSSVDEVGAP
jgi:hypothetical protein